MKLMLKEEFENSNSDSENRNDNSNFRNNTPKPIPDIVKNSNFKLDENSTDDNGLAIGNNEYVAVRYNKGENSVTIQINNNLDLDSNDLKSFKDEFTKAEKLMNLIINNMK